MTEESTKHCVAEFRQQLPDALEAWSTSASSAFDIDEARAADEGLSQEQG